MTTNSPLVQPPPSSVRRNPSAVDQHGSHEARPRADQPQASSSSSSSSVHEQPSVVSAFDELNGYDDPVPPKFLITLTSGKHEEHFHCFSLIGAMLSLDAPENPLTRESVPKDTLRQIAEKIGVDPDRFINIWINANSTYPQPYQYAQRREHRFQLFRDLIYSEEGSASERKKRSEARDLMADPEREDWKILIRR